MWAGSYSLLVLAKNLHNPKKAAETSNNGALKICMVAIAIIMYYNEILRNYQQSMWAEIGI